MMKTKRLYCLLLVVTLLASSHVLADYYHSDTATGPKTPPGSESLSVLTFSALRTASHTFCEQESCGPTGFVYHKKEQAHTQAPILDTIKTCVAQGGYPDFQECVEGLVYNRSRTSEDFEIGAADYAISKKLMAVAWVEVAGLLPTFVSYKYSVSQDGGQSWSAEQDLATYQLDEYAGAAAVQDVDVAFNDDEQLAIAIFLDQDRGSNITVLGNSSQAYISLLHFSPDGTVAAEVPVVTAQEDAPHYETLGDLNIMDLAGGQRDTFHLAYAKGQGYEVFTEQSRSSYVRSIPAPYGIGSTFPELSPHEGTFGLVLIVERGSMMLGQEGNFFVPDEGMSVYGMTSQIYPRENIASSVASQVRVNETFMPAPSANIMFYANGSGRDAEELLQVNETQYWPEYFTDLWTLRCRHELGLDPGGSGQVWERFCYTYEPVGIVDSIRPNVGSSSVVVGSRYYKASILTTETNDEVLPWYGYNQKVSVSECDLEGGCAPPPAFSWFFAAGSSDRRDRSIRQNVILQRKSRAKSVQPGERPLPVKSALRGEVVGVKGVSR